MYINHILDAISRIERYAAVEQERFFAEALLQDAVIRQWVKGSTAKVHH